MNKQDIENVLNKVPNLVDFGICVKDADWPEQGQEFLKTRTEICTKICEWLSQLRKVKLTQQSGLSSYGLKHRFESSTDTYCSNGEFIVAAIHCGFPHKIENNINVYFACSKKDLNRLFDKNGQPVSRLINN